MSPYLVVRVGVTLHLLLAALPAAGQQSSTGLPRPSQLARLPATPAGVIDGAVTDTALAPLAMVEVSVLRTSLRLFTSRGGRFRISDVAAGHYIVIVRRIGFRPISQLVEVRENDTLHLVYELEPLPKNLLDTVRIIAERTSRDLQEFEVRRIQGVGEFLTREQVARRGSVELVDLLRGFRSISIASDPTKGIGVPEQIAYNRRDFGNFLTQGPGTCPMQVIVDGAPMPGAFDLSLGPRVSEIAGIEVYAGPSTVPPRFQGIDLRCGLILIWTRVGP